MKKVTIILAIVLGVLLVGVGIYYICKVNTVPEFNVSDYSWEIKHFPSDIEVGYIGDKKTALEKAEQIMQEVFGDDTDFRSEKPFDVYYDKENEVWLIQGSVPEKSIGGTTKVVVTKENGDVLTCLHTYP